MVIPDIKDRLLKHPEVKYKESNGYLEVPAQTPHGFKVWIREGPEGCEVGYEGWHEEFTEGPAALNCFASGLSTDCRLRIFRRGGMDYRWQVLYQSKGAWVIDSETGLLLYPFFLRKDERELQNNILNPAAARPAPP